MQLNITDKLHEILTIHNNLEPFSTDNSALSSMIDINSKIFLHFLNCDKDEIQTLDKYNRISAILHKLTSSNAQALKVSNSNQWTNSANFLGDAIINILESFSRFLQFNQETSFTLKEYNQLSATLHKLTSSNIRYVKTTSNNLNETPPTSKLLKSIHDLIIASYLAFMSNHEYASFSIDEVEQIVSITSKLMSANTQHKREEMKKNKPLLKNQKKSTNTTPIASSTPSTSKDETDKEIVNTQVPIPNLTSPCPIVHTPNPNKSGLAFNKKHSRKLRKKLRSR